MQPNQQTTQLLNRTIDTFNGDTQVISSTDGVSLIDNWISALHSGDASTNPIASTLSELKAELQRGNPDSEAIRSFLDQLSTQAKDAGHTASGAAQASLNELSMALQSFSQQLGGQHGPANTSSRAPMTSTVGGESTVGHYTSAGTYSTDMDDQTGSNAGATGENDSPQAPDTGNTQGGGSYGSGYGTGSEGRQDAENSGTSRSSDSDMDDQTGSNAGR